MRIARHLGVSEKEVEEIEYGALLHDVGKIAIQHDILLKPGRLDENERELMKTHPKVGHDILKGMKFLEGAAEGRVLPPRAAGRRRLPARPGVRPHPDGRPHHHGRSTRSTP